MTRQDLHKELSEVLYIEDTNLIDTVLAATIANSQKMGDPVWLTIIGPSSGGKSQYIRPLAKANPPLFLQIDDLSSNTLVSGNGPEQSLITRIKGTGVLLMDDLTVLASKNAEDRNAILAQFRMIYDGHISKGTGKGSIVKWEGHAGMIAGSTPSIYRLFSDVADMGERFISYRMKSMDVDKAMKYINTHNRSARHIDDTLKDIYARYMGELIPNIPEEIPPVDQKTVEMIETVSKTCTKLRTPVVIDDREHFVSEFVVPEMPFRVYKQLMNLAKAFMAMHFTETGEDELPEDLRNAIAWVGYSIADDKRRAYFNAVVALEATSTPVTAANISAYTGLHKQAVERGMSVLTAIGIVHQDIVQKGAQDRKEYRVSDRDLRSLVRRIDPPKVLEEMLFED